MQVIAYDGSGRRVSKTRMRKAEGGDWETELVTHYTGIGTEIREDNMNGTRVVVNLPQGLGRYMPEDASAPVVPSTTLDENGKPTDWSVFNPKFEWYLKNHLGSTMLVYGTSAYDDSDFSKFQDGVQAAYDYRAFGEQVDLEQKGDKVTENFTGKEKDDETDLNYFGARYLDPMLGLWTSVDPARQFASPYLYVGNGMNPVNGIDGDGNYYEDEYGRTNQGYNYVIPEFQGTVSAVEMDAILSAQETLQGQLGLLDFILPNYAFQSYMDNKEIAFGLDNVNEYTEGTQKYVTTTGLGKNVFHLHTFRYDGSQEGFSPNDNGMCNRYDRSDYMMEITSGNVYFQNAKVNNLNYPGTRGNYFSESSPFLLMNIPLTSPLLNYTPNR